MSDSHAMTQEEALAAFAAADVARLATVGADGRPHLVPVTFAVMGDRGDAAVVFAVDHKVKSTPNLKRLTNIAAHPRVCFLVDRYSDDWSALWWVRADAVAQVHDAGQLWASVIDALVAKYPQYQQVRPVGAVVWASVDGWTGWKA